MDEDATAILQVHPEADDTAAQVQQSPTLSLQLNRGNTQRTVAEQPIEETQENEGEVTADKAASTASQATSSSSGTPSVASSSGGPEGNENVNNNSMDYEHDSANRQVEKRSSVVASTVKMRPTEAQALDAATMPNNPSLAFHLPEHAFSGQLEGNNTLDEFAGMD